MNVYPIKRLSQNFTQFTRNTYTLRLPTVNPLGITGL